MTMVWGDPAGFAVDWDGQRGLTEWELAGRRSEPRFDRKVLEHELSARPASERRVPRICWPPLRVAAGPGTELAALAACHDHGSEGR